MSSWKIRILGGVSFLGAVWAAAAVDSTDPAATSRMNDVPEKAEAMGLRMSKDLDRAPLWVDWRTRAGDQAPVLEVVAADETWDLVVEANAVVSGVRVSWDVRLDPPRGRDTVGRQKYVLPLGSAPADAANAVLSGGVDLPREADSIVELDFVVDAYDPTDGRHVERAVSPRVYVEGLAAPLPRVHQTDPRPPTSLGEPDGEWAGGTPATGALPTVDWDARIATEDLPEAQTHVR